MPFKRKKPGIRVSHETVVSIRGRDTAEKIKPASTVGKVIPSLASDFDALRLVMGVGRFPRSIV